MTAACFDPGTAFLAVVVAFVIGVLVTLLLSGLSDDVFNGGPDHDNY